MFPEINSKNGKNLKILYLANTDIFWNGWELTFEKLDMNQIANFAYEPKTIIWWIAIFGLGFFAFLAIVFYKNCFGFNCFMNKKFADDECDDD